MVSSQPSNTFERPPFLYRHRPGELPQITDLTAIVGTGHARHFVRHPKEELYELAINTDFQNRKLKLGQKILEKLLLLMVAWHRNAEDTRQEITSERFRDCSQVAAELAQVIVNRNTEATLWLVESILPFLKLLITEAIDQAGTDAPPAEK